MTTVRQWSGREVRALREARRMSIRDFARHLGVSDRMVSKWEAGGQSIKPRPMNQAVLDTSLERAGDDAQARFVLLIDASVIASIPEQTSTPEATHVRHPADGKLMALVDAGVYLSGPANEPVWLPAFYIDVYPTTNADYSRFVRATGYRPPSHWPEGICTSELSDHPATFVSWNDASAYARWADKSLPSSQEWEKAARGPRGNVYPWGDRPTPAKCNVREGSIRNTTPVGRYQSGTSIYGIFDLCGNVWEWCRTETTPGRFELKGSAFTSGFERATPSNFNDADALMLDDDTGFRCVVVADAMQALLAA
ncbi:SUMF1/EgtB/PvdO family nonheme iron enzyme [Micromonospora sp. WMMA1923]|uniref:SUMF1/EgtB/PvdO family nonheme iron enzyme n=1 Tax=Micromonospora sp. WMMA1923 TaxID=3404125 RepID=UPI003B93AB35